MVYIGNIDAVGDMSEDSPGSDRIVEVLLDDEPGPVYLQAWGGTNTIARALWKIQHEYPGQVEKVSRKAIIYIILDQDKTFREYIAPNWPEIQVLGSFWQFGSIAYWWLKIIPEDLHPFFRKNWMEKNILSGHGPLCARYETATVPNRWGTEDGDFLSEGDSPAFMHQIDVGLRSMEHPSFGGWGGRFEPENGSAYIWKGAVEDEDLYKPIWRWAEAFQNDWAARADWCIMDYEAANHAPVVRLKGNTDLEADPGDKILLDVSRSTDPDGDELQFRWWQYGEADSYEGTISIENAGSPRAYFTIPADANSGETIHIICDVTDNGNPSITRYCRVIIEVTGGIDR